MPSAIAGIIAQEKPGNGGVSVDAMAIAGLPVTGRTETSLVQGAASFDRPSPETAYLFDGDGEEQSAAEIRADSVVLRRDSLGVCPLYYSCSSDRRSLAFASRPTQLLRLGWVDRSPDWETILDTLVARPAQDRTCTIGIRQVPPGHRLEWRPGSLTVGQEWDPRRFLWDGGRGPERPAEEFANLLEQAVRRRVNEQTTLLLSGGLDSTSVAAAAVRQGLGLRTLSSVFPRFPTVDESARIRDVQTALGLQGDFVELDDHGLDIDYELALHGEPHSLTTHGHTRALMRAASVRGYQRLVDGYDGDGVLGPMVGLGPILATRPRLAAATLQYLSKAGMPAGRALATWIGDCAPPTVRRAVRRVRPQALTVVPWVDFPTLLRGRALEPARQIWGEGQLRAAVPEYSVLVARIAADHGIDIVHPFADRQLVEFLLGLPPEAKYAGGRWKALSRDGFPELPPSVRNRAGKTMFTAAVFARHPLERLAPYLMRPTTPVPGIDYDKLRRRLARGRPCTVPELILMRKLALVHRFLEPVN